MELKKINDFTWEIPKEGGMRVPARIFASEKLMEKIRNDRTLRQAMSVAHLKGILKYSYVMPDAHEGYGFPIGGVAAFDLDEGVISPGGVGYDINCSVRVLRTGLTEQDVRPKLMPLLEELFRLIPPGVGRAGQMKLSKDEMGEVLSKGSRWALENGYATKDDLERTEDNGNSKQADPHMVSNRAIQRGLSQMGTLGAGNHFIEIQKVDRIFDEKVAKAFGITGPGQVTVMIHCGSRGLGHQVASDYIKEMEDKYGWKDLPDRELINAPIQSELGQKYHKAMFAALNFAFANKQLIAHWARKAFETVLGSSEEMDTVYDVAHNLAKFEKHKIDGEVREVCIHRKGATRSFGPGREEIPDVYRDVGQPVLIPGSMGTASYILCGTNTAENVSFSSTAHGAGRVMSRHAAIRNYRGESVVKEMERRGILIKGASWKGIAEEAWQAYKDIDEVAKVSTAAEIGKAVVRLVPLGVVKG